MKMGIFVNLYHYITFREKLRGFTSFFFENLDEKNHLFFYGM